MLILAVWGNCPTTHSYPHMHLSFHYFSNIRALCGGGLSTACKKQKPAKFFAFSNFARAALASTQALLAYTSIHFVNFFTLYWIKSRKFPVKKCLIFYASIPFGLAFCHGMTLNTKKVWLWFVKKTIIWVQVFQKFNKVRF